VNYGDISGSSYYTGGIAGTTTGYRVASDINACLNAGAVSAFEFMGGIIGYAFNARISSCLNVGAVEAGNGSGGIVGNTISDSSSLSECYYDTAKTAGQILWDDDGGFLGEAETPADNYGTGLTTSALISRSFLNKLNKASQNWTLPPPGDYHYYPVPSAFENNTAVFARAVSAVPAYKGVPVLSSYKLTYGQALSTLTFGADAEGVFSWLEPDAVPGIGKQAVYASFVPFSDNYGELYDIEILITVAAPLDITWLWGMLACSAVFLLAAFAAIKFRVPARIKQAFAPKTVIVEKEVIIERTATETPMLNVAEGAYNIDYKLRRIYRNDEDALLTPKEFAMFEFLFRNENTLFTAEELFANIWGNSAEIDVRTVRVHIANIRKKLALDRDNGIIIETRKRKNYVLIKTR
jgi:hypothetical protein